MTKRKVVHTRHALAVKDVMSRILGMVLIIVAVGFPVYAQKAPQIIPRAGWEAKKAVGEGKKHKIKFITIHHTATKQRPDLPIETKLRNLQAFSQRDDKLASGKAKPAWFDVPYHYYIAVDGKIAEGREIKFAGDTNTEYDPTSHALIVLEGSFGTDEPLPPQVDSLKAMVKWLAAKYKVSKENIKGHKDYAETACPGSNLEKLLPQLRTWAK